MKATYKGCERTVNLILLVITTLFLATACSKRDAKDNSRQPEILQVQTITVKQQAISRSVSGYGSLIAPDAVSLRAPVSGIIGEKHGFAGQKVSCKTLLFVVKSNDLSMTLQALKAEMIKNQQDYQRKAKLSKLYPSGISELDVISAKEAYAQSKSAWQRAQNLQYIKAPVAGIISDTPYAVGDYVNEGDTLLNITNFTNLQLVYTLPFRYLKALHPGQTVIFDATGSTQTVKARVRYIAPQVDNHANLIRLRADIDQDQRQSAASEVNTFGRIRQILNPHDPEIVIPLTDIQSDQRGFYVFLLNAASETEKRYIKISEVLQKGRAVVESGLKQGDRLITDKLEQLKNGMKVKALNG